MCSSSENGRTWQNNDFLSEEFRDFFGGGAWKRRESSDTRFPKVWRLHGPCLWPRLRSEAKRAVQSSLYLRLSEQVPYIFEYTAPRPHEVIFSIDVRSGRQIVFETGVKSSSEPASNQVRKKRPSTRPTLLEFSILTPDTTHALAGSVSLSSQHVRRPGQVRTATSQTECGFIIKRAVVTIIIAPSSVSLVAVS